MKTYSSKEMLKIIPLDQGLRDELIKAWDAGDKSSQFELGLAIWKVFNEYRDILKAKYLDLAMVDVKMGKKSLDDVKKDADKVVWQEIDDIFTGKKSETQEIEQLREKLKAFSQPQK